MRETTKALTLKSQQQDRESSYFSYEKPGYPVNGSAPKPSVFGGSPAPLLPLPYGGSFAIESFTAFASWVSSAIDLARFEGAIAQHRLPMMSTTRGWPERYYTLSAARSAADPKNYGWYGLGWDAIFQFKNSFNDPNWAKDGNFGISSSDDHVYDWDKTGWLNGSSTEITITRNGYTIALLFGASYQHAKTQSLITSIENILYAAPAPTGYDFFPQYSEGYTDWQDEKTFNETLHKALENGLSPSRLDGVRQPQPPSCTGTANLGLKCVVDYKVKYRARLGASPFGGTTNLLGQSCQSMVKTLQSGKAGQLVSLQKYQADDSSWKYQAVFTPTPTPVCKGELANGLCCPDDNINSGGTCVACPSNQEPQYGGRSCGCGYMQVVVGGPNGRCEVCPAYEVPNSDQTKCVCEPNYKLIKGACIVQTCPQDGQIYRIENNECVVMPPRGGASPGNGNSTVPSSAH
jgi:hypothetical protein